MKRTIVLLGILMLFSTLSFSQKVRKDKIKYSFIQRENINEKDFVLFRLMRKYESNVVRDANSAAALAYIYASNLYGEKAAKLERPYQVKLVNDSAWEVVGNDIPRGKHPKIKGSFIMLIHKRTGQLLFFMHEK